MSEKQEVSIDLGRLLKNYFKVAKRCWWILVASTVLFAALVPFALQWTRTPEYKATCSFTVRVVSNSVTDSINSQYNIYYDKDLAEQLEKTFTFILTSDHLGDDVRQILDRELEAHRIEAVCVKGSNLFTITVKGDTPQQAYEMLVTIMDVFPEAARYVVGDLVVEMLEEPKADETPANAVNVKLMAVLGAMLGFAAASGVLVLKIWSVRTVQKPEELEELLNMSCLGIVPVTNQRTNNITEGEFRESIRGITRKVETAMEQEKIKVLLVTGTMPGEGKSLLSRYLAQTLAEWGKKVCLVDCDLRRPALYKMLKCTQKELPMEDFLRGEAELDAVACKTTIKNLTLVGNSNSIQEPTVLLESKAMENLIQTLSDQADCVILDSPPCDFLSDVSVLQKYAQRILYVVRQDHAPLEKVVDTVQSLSQDESKLMGFVLNFAEKTAGGYGKYGYGAYSYGKYGNGYYGKYGHYSKYSKYLNTERMEGPSER